MDGIYFLVLLAFGALTGALLALCAALGANLPAGRAGSDDTGAHPAQTRHSATDRRL
ncbi:hypothetical protein D9X30_0622 [Cupriavidus sp. U2]|uniref:hypothetical protein n=1 Tax=Cupriavidus sp. U2 TaxID=2920269 RepID=UPI00189299A7|nr:hypothetical protein [Cupriavidus sp. U2]KAI3594390.1 hypothetical protein D9X30_0622 [Cupriavidus sp. U2]